MTETTPATNENEEKTVVIPEGAELVDDVFYVWETRFGLFQTMTKDGRMMLTGGVRDATINMTRWHLKCEQEGSLDDHTRVINDGVVGGKL